MPAGGQPQFGSGRVRCGVDDSGRLRLTVRMSESEQYSSNTRPGEPLRSWLESTPVVKHDAMSVVTFADARDALS